MLCIPVIPNGGWRPPPSNSTIFGTIPIEAAVRAMSMYIGSMGITEERIEILSKSNNSHVIPIAKVVKLSADTGTLIELVTDAT